MSITLSTQARLFPNSGTTGWEEGDGMSTRIAMDMIKMCNNLWGYCDLKVAYVQPAGTFLSANIASLTDLEVYLVQIPVIVPLGAKRLVFTAGMQTTATAGVASVETVRVYLASRHYVGAGPATAFDTTALPLGYKSRDAQTTIDSPAGGTSAYTLVDDSTTGMVDPPRWWGVLDSFTPGAYLIVTCIGSATDLNGSPRARLYDFTAWYLME